MAAERELTHMATPTLLYHVTDLEHRESILRDGLKARAGSWLRTEWKPRVFFVTNRMGAFEIAQLIIHERRGPAYMFVLVDSGKLRGKLRQDLDFEHGVWTPLDVPPEAIVGTEEVDEDFFESREFLEHMGEWEEEEEGEEI
jgi:RNA:NAD 2'-phosphotransferase (TPT1/KptA family)